MSRLTERPSSLDRWLIEENSWDQRHDDREYLPPFSAHRSVEEPWRLDRLGRVYATAKALFLLVEHRPLPGSMVSELRDRTGELTVLVIATDWAEYFEPFFRLAWKAEQENPAKVQMRWEPSQTSIR